MPKDLIASTEDPKVLNQEAITPYRMRYGTCVETILTADGPKKVKRITAAFQGRTINSKDKRNILILTPWGLAATVQMLIEAAGHLGGEYSEALDKLVPDEHK